MKAEQRELFVDTAPAVSIYTCGAILFVKWLITKILINSQDFSSDINNFIRRYEKIDMLSFVKKVFDF